MSILVTFNGSTYIIPETNEVGWGSNLDSYLVAIAAGALQKTGGSFTLSGEIDFGASFGIKSLYYKSRTANPALTGVVRLANNSDSVSFRNFANSADLPLFVNASDQLSFNGTTIPQDSTLVHIAGAETITGTKTFSAPILAGADNAYDIGSLTTMFAGIYGQTLFAGHDGVGGEVWMFPPTVGSGFMRIVPADSGFGAVLTLTNASLATSRTYTYPEAGANASFVMTEGAQTINGIKTFSSAIGTALTASRAVATNGSGQLVASATTDTELGFVSGVTSAIQTQLNGKLTAAGGTLTGDITFASGKGIFWTDSGTNTVKITAPTTITSTYALKWPIAQGSSGQFLTNDGSGNMSWTNAAGTGTVNSGTQFQLGYYATTSTTISGLPIITGVRALVSDTNGLPVASTTTTPELQGLHLLTASRVVTTNGSGILTTSGVTVTELSFVSGVTSAIQTQINAKKTIATGNAFKFETTDASGNLQETTVTASRAVATDSNGLPVASTTTAIELGYVNGVTSAIQTQLNTKAPTSSPTFTGTITTPLTAARAVITDGASALAVSPTTSTEVGYLSGVSSAIQTQLNTKIDTAGTGVTKVGTTLNLSTPVAVSNGGTGSIRKLMGMTPYTGNGVNGRTVAHGMGQTPDVVMVVRLDATTETPAIWVTGMAAPTSKLFSGTASNTLIEAVDATNVTLGTSVVNPNGVSMALVCFKMQ